MKNEVPDPEEVKELRELIRVKVDIYGLTKEDIEYLIDRSKKILEKDRQW